MSPLLNPASFRQIKANKLKIWKINGVTNPIKYLSLQHRVSSSYSSNFLTTLSQFIFSISFPLAQSNRLYQSYIITIPTKLITTFISVYLNTEVGFGVWGLGFGVWAHFFIFLDMIEEYENHMGQYSRSFFINKPTIHPPEYQESIIVANIFQLQYD